jgi:hypothetical protein
MDVRTPVIGEGVSFSTGTDFWIGFKDVESITKPEGHVAAGPPYHAATKFGIVVHRRDFTPDWIYTHLCVDRPSVIYAEGIFREEADAIAWVTNAY